MTSTTSRVERTRRDPEEVVANLVQGLVLVCARVCAWICVYKQVSCMYKNCIYIYYINVYKEPCIHTHIAPCLNQKIFGYN